MKMDLDTRTCELCRAHAADTLIVALRWTRVELTSGRPVDACPDCTAREDWPRLLFALDRADVRARERTLAEVEDGARTRLAA